MMTRRGSFALGALGAVIILCALGTWQVQRLAWKEALIAERVAGFNAAPVEIMVVGDDISAWRRVRVQGIWIGKKALYVGPLSHQGRTGWFAISPLRLASGDVVLINRGFSSSRAAPPTDGNPVSLEGILRRPGPTGYFAPENDPAAGQWFRVAPDEMANFLKLENVRPYWVEATGAGARNGLTPVGILRLPPNNHLQYAVTWFAFALTAAVIGMIFWVRNR